MKTVYIAHSKGLDYQRELYGPIRESAINNLYSFVLPHEDSESLYSSKELFRDICDVIVVEASEPKIGVGIEVGWADAYGVPIISMHKKGTRLSTSIRPMSREIIEYSTTNEMISGLEHALKKVL